MFDGNGNWISNFSAVADRNADIKILASRFDNIFIADIAESFEDCLTKDMQVKPTQNFDANNFRVIDVADPVADNDAVNLQTLNARIAAVEQDPILAFKWSDYEINDQSWLRADTFSWNDGTVYTNAYTHLYNDIQDVTSSTETIGSYTITYYKAEDGHKIVMADQETTVQNIYNESGIAWYYILDTTNQRFKLPRTKYGFTGLRDEVGKYVEAGLPNINGTFNPDGYYSNENLSGAFYNTGTRTKRAKGTGTDNTGYEVAFSSSRSNSIYGNSNTVQPPATQMYLYFYVGQFTQTATEQTAGITTTQLGKKVDLDAANLSTAGKSLISGLGMPGDTYEDLTSSGSGTTYTATANGFVYASYSISSATYTSLFVLKEGETTLSNQNIVAAQQAPNATGDAIYYLPIKKGQTAYLNFGGSASITNFRFVYAEGEV